MSYSVIVTVLSLGQLFIFIVSKPCSVIVSTDLSPERVKLPPPSIQLKLKFVIFVLLLNDKFLYFPDIYDH
nr:MAG TPA: hypothetical protein [Crassvirales sp.]